jgi:hypothetical protein
MGWSGHLQRRKPMVGLHATWKPYYSDVRGFMHMYSDNFDSLY